MNWYWIVFIVLASIILGYGIERYGETCDDCQARKKKWFGNPTDPTELIAKTIVSNSPNFKPDPPS